MLSFCNSVGEEGSFIENKVQMMNVKDDCKINHFNFMNSSSPLSSQNMLFGILASPVPELRKVESKIFETGKDSVDNIEVQKQSNEELNSIPPKNVNKIEAPLIYKTMN
jgi:hypothetical protein